MGRFFLRQILGTHRALRLWVFDAARAPMVEIERPFYVFVSDIKVRTIKGQPLGYVKQRWIPFFSRYDLYDDTGAMFGRISEFALKLLPFARVWAFRVRDGAGRTTAKIEKRWGGFLREAFTSADDFAVSIFDTETFGPARRSVLLAAVLAIDLDRFEVQSKGDNSPLGVLGDIASLTD